MPNRFCISLLCVLFLPFAYVYAQGGGTADTAARLSLAQCIRYALANQPAARQAQLDVRVARLTNAINTSGWLPQANLSVSAQHYFKLPAAFIPDANNPTGPKLVVTTGLPNVATPSLSLSQVVFNPDVLYGSRTAHLLLQQARQATTLTDVNLVTNVSKAFYDLQLTLQQVDVLKEDTARLGRNLRDTYYQYVSGIKDKVDYRQANIMLNNSLSQLRTAIENIAPRYTALRQWMGYPANQSFNIYFDSAQAMQQMQFDTTQPLNYQNRIEYQQLATTKGLQQQLTGYYRSSFLPSVSLFYNYALTFESAEMSKLFDRSYPYSTIGLQISLPLFQGFRRIESVRRGHLLEQRVDLDIANLELQISTQYRQALATYKSNLYELQVMQQNVQMAREVYDIVKLQYRQGVKAYLDVITAESDLRTSEISYLNALFQLLSSKVDLERAMGVKFTEF